MTVKRTRRRALALTLGVTLAVITGRVPAHGQAFVPIAPPSTTIFPLEDVRPGLKGVAYTVFEGIRPEAMDVEILGRLKNALGPGRDMILARLHGPKPEYTGVVAGMSGSPVYIDGKLLGALGFRIGQFSKEPIAGITPIGQMLEVQNAASIQSDAGTPKLPVNSASSGLPDLRPMEAPLVFGGFGTEAITRFGGAFRELGLEPVAGLGSMDQSRRQPEPLEPGSAVSAVLVDGDLSITGTCTVSYLDANRLMACGHPITQAGTVDLPMAKAEVLATLSSPLNSFKIVNATEIVGAFTEDRSSAIFGRVGAHARMIPVTIAIHSEQPALEKTMHLSVANHRELTPQLMLVSIFQSLQQVETSGAEASYHLHGEIDLSPRQPDGTMGAPLPPVHLDSWMAPGDTGAAAVSTAIAVGGHFTELFANPIEQPVMTGVTVDVDVSPRRRSAEIDNARLLTPEASPGDSIQVEAVLRPYQQPAQTLHLTLPLPKTLDPGTLRLLVSDGATLDRLLESPSSHPLGLADTVARMNALHANDRVYVTLLDRNAQAVLDATALTDIPLSMANVLDPLKATQRLRLTGESVLSLGSVAADNAVTGSQVLSLTIR